MKRLLNIFGVIALASPLSMVTISCHPGNNNSNNSNNNIIVSQLKNEDTIQGWNQVFNNNIFYQNDSFIMQALSVNANNNISINQLFQFNNPSNKLLVTDPLVTPTDKMILIEIGTEKQTNKTGDFKIMLYKISPKLNSTGIYTWDYNDNKLFYTTFIKCLLPVIDFDKLKLDDYSEYVKNIDQINTIKDFDPAELEKIKTKLSQYFQTTVQNNWGNVVYQVNSDYNINFVTLVKNSFNFVENSWWNKKNHQYDNLKTNFV